MAGVTLKCKAVSIHFDQSGRLRWSKCAQKLCTVIGIQWFCMICILALLLSNIIYYLLCFQEQLQAWAMEPSAWCDNLNHPFQSISQSPQSEKTLAKRCQNTVSKHLIGSLALTVVDGPCGSVQLSVSKARWIRRQPTEWRDRGHTIPGTKFSTKQDSWLPNRLATHRTQTWQTWSQVSYSVNEESWEIKWNKRSTYAMLISSLNMLPRYIVF